MKKLSLVLAVWAASTIAAPEKSTPEKTEFDSNGLTNVSIDNSSGNITLEATNGPKTIVTVDKKDFSKFCQLRVERKGSKLVLESKPSNPVFFLSKCEVDFQVQVPRKFNVDLALGHGDVELKGLEGKVDFKVGAGTIKGDGIFHSVDGKTGAGSINLTGIVGGAELKTGAGDVRLKVAEALKGTLDVRTGAGDALVSVPKGTRLSATLTSGVGKVSNEFGDTPGAPYKVSMKSGTGDLKIQSH